jgi:predicted O-methyltransferase YrrM
MSMTTQAGWLRTPMAAALDIAADPLEVCIQLQERFADWRAGAQPVCKDEPNRNWEALLHEHLGAEWPCRASAEFWDVWREVLEDLEREGIRPGPGSFKAYNDGDAGFTRAIWCAVRHLKPENVVETGVAHGVTSRFILEALERNGQGHLWSIDLPPWERVWQKQVGVAVREGQKRRWSYIKGSSRRRLPGLLAKLGGIDLFIHDSLHSQRNVLFELERAWANVRRGGVVMVDDVDVNTAFQSFTRPFASDRSMICEAEPAHPDVRRFNQKGLFGIILKD